MSSSHSSEVKMKPLRLKDFLREDCNSDSSASGFLAFPKRAPQTTVRYLLQIELLKNGKITARKGLLVKRSVRNKLLRNKLSAVLDAVRSLPFKSSSSLSSSSPGSSLSSADPKHGNKILSRSFSRKFLRGSFWKKRLAEDTTVQIDSTSSVVGRNKVLIRDIIRLGSFTDEERGGKPIDIPPISGRNSFSCSSSGWSECGRVSTTSSGIDSVPSPSSPVSTGFSESVSTKPVNLNNSNPDGHATGDPTATSNGCVESKVKRQSADCNCLSYEVEKEQFSPVSVMDFPYEDDEEEEEEEMDEEETVATPPSSFHQTLAKIENARCHLLHKIRRLEDVALLVNPIDLNDSFDSENQHESEEEPEIEPEEETVETARGLLEKLKSTLHFEFDRNSDSNCFDSLLLDFFVEVLSRHEFSREDTTAEDDLLSVARDWIVGSGSAVADGATGGGVELQVREMESDKRWRCFVQVEEAEIVAADLELEVFSSLMDQVLLDLVEV